MATVKLYFNVVGLLRKVYRDIAGLPRKDYRDIAGLPRKVADVNWFAVDISICLHLSKSQICIFWVLTIVVSTLRVSTTKNVLKFFSTRPYKQHIPMKITLEHAVEVKNTRLTGSSWNLGSDTEKKKPWPLWRRHTGVKSLRFTLPPICERTCNLPIYNYSQPTWSRSK